MIPPDEVASAAALRARIAQLEAEAAHLQQLLQRRTLLARLAVLRPDRLVRRGAGYLRRTAVRSRRLRWTESGWRRSLDARVFTAALTRKAAAVFRGPASAVYDASPHKPPAARRARVLHVIANAAVGGSTQLVVDLMNGLGHRWEMQVLTSAAPPRGHSGMPLHLAPQPASPALVRTILREVRPDLLHVHYWGDVDEPWYSAVFREAEALGLPVLQNVNTPVAPFRSPAVRTTVFVSDYVRRAFGPGVGEERVIWPGSDFARFREPDTDDPHAGDSVGMVYRLERDKLNEDAILPLIEIVRRRPRTRAVVVGDGSLYVPFLERVRAAGLENNFEFPGAAPYEDLPGWYGKFSVFVAPVRKESFGQVTPFAMGMGRAVVGARVGALPEILGGEEWLGDTPEAIAERAVRLLDDPALRSQVARANRTRALSLFGVEAMIAAYAELYERLAPSRDLLPGLPAAELFAA